MFCIIFKVEAVQLITILNGVNRSTLAHFLIFEGYFPEEVSLIANQLIKRCEPTNLNQLAHFCLTSAHPPACEAVCVLAFETAAEIL